MILAGLLLRTAGVNTSPRRFSSTETGHEEISAA